MTHRRPRSEAFAGDASEALRTSLRYDFPTYAAAPVLSTPLSNRTAKYAERAARAQVRRQKLTYDSLEIEVAAEVRAAVRQVTYQAERVKAAAESLRLADRQLVIEDRLAN